MKTIRTTTLINAPMERCFKLSTSIDLHLDSAKATRETAIDGVTSGLIRAGDTVTWQGRHFGWKFTHQSLISIYRPYFHFRDVMVKGAFKVFEHDHHFATMNDGTRMRDELRFAAPFWMLGRLAEKMWLERYLIKFLHRRNAFIKQIAESETGWQRYVNHSSFQEAAAYTGSVSK
jgi:ligand-binding SRPBCC domain-containing protein